MGHERGDPNDGIVSPIGRMSHHPEIEPGREHRPTQALHELLHSGQRGAGVDDERNRLKDADTRMGFHPPHELDHGVAVHQAVGVEHDHIAELPAPAATEISHVAALALEIDPPAAVMDAPFRAEFAHRLCPGALLLDQHVRLTGVAEYEKREPVPLASGLQRQPGRAQPREYPLRIFIADRHQERRARLSRQRARRIGPHQKAVAAGQQRDEAEDRRPESHRDPCEQDHEDRQQRQAQEEFLRARQNPSHHISSRESGRRNQKRQKKPAPLCNAAPIAQRRVRGPAPANHACSRSRPGLPTACPRDGSLGDGSTGLSTSAASGMESASDPDESAASRPGCGDARPTSSSHRRSRPPAPAPDPATLRGGKPRPRRAASRHARLPEPALHKDSAATRLRDSGTSVPPVRAHSHQGSSR